MPSVAQRDPALLPKVTQRWAWRGGPASTGTAAPVQIFAWWESAAASFPRCQPGLRLLQGVKVFHRSGAPVLRAGMLRYFRALECESLREHAL